MAIPGSGVEALTDHVTLEVEFVEGTYRNLDVPNLRDGTGVVRFFEGHRDATFASSALIDSMTRDFVRAVETRPVPPVGARSRS